MSERYPPIGDYALLADCFSSALVSRACSVDWACLRSFDAASVFGRLLDWERGGFFALTPVDQTGVSRRYRNDSLVLETTVATSSGRARVLDAFAMRRGGSRRPRYQLLRVVEGLEGKVDFDVVIEPRFDYGELHPWLRHHADTGAWSAVGGDSALVLSLACELDLVGPQARLVGRLSVGAGDRRGLSVEAQLPHLLKPEPCPQKEIFRRLDETQAWWDRWASATRVDGPWDEAVRRSAVVLKGLTCAPTGAMIAAPTTSLPEDLGGERNWDYRYAWIRDSTLALAALSIVGHDEVARGFRDFLMRSAAGSAQDLQIMYGVTGRRSLPEIELDLDGYRGSRPVRVGNSAAKQVQHDMYGHILDTAHLWHRTHEELDPGEWRFLSQLVDAAADRWTAPDRGIWEIRGEPQHFTSSKVMLWVALDRGIKTAEEADFADTSRLGWWRRVRDEIREAVDRRGVHPTDGHYVQAFGSTEVDAALLLLPTVGYCAATDERMVRTVEAIRRDLAVPPDGFLRRYRTSSNHDGLRGSEGTFLMCTFWLVDVLALQGRLDEASALFERLLTCGNDLGLYAEQYDPHTGELLGNFPQAFTHMALINSAHQLRGASRPHTAEILHTRISHGMGGLSSERLVTPSSSPQGRV
ncbi:MAG: glycoside hydrolase family 15 protein [Egibacteraceae bacterium]